MAPYLNQFPLPRKPGRPEVDESRPLPPKPRRPPPRSNPDLLELFAHAPRGHSTFTPRNAEWRASHRPPRPFDAARALDGKLRLALDHLESASVLILDVDAHGIKESQITKKHRELSKAAGHVVAINGKRLALSRAEAKRHLVAERCTPAVAALRDLCPEAFVESSANGVHAFLLLAERIDPREAAATAARLLAATGPQPLVTVESFPRLDADNVARLCRLPLTGLPGEGRLLAPNFTSWLHPTRLDDQRSLDASPALPLDALLARLDLLAPAPTLPDHSSYTVPQVVRRLPQTEGDRRSDPTDPDPPGDLDQDRKTTPRYGKDFHRWVRRYITLGIRDDESRDALMTLAWATKGCGLSLEESLHAFRLLIAKPIHGSTRCQTTGGRRRLAGSFRAYWRKLDIVEGIRTTSTRRLVYGLLGRADWRSDRDDEDFGFGLAPPTEAQLLARRSERNRRGAETRKLNAAARLAARAPGALSSPHELREEAGGDERAAALGQTPGREGARGEARPNARGAQAHRGERRGGAAAGAPAGHDRPAAAHPGARDPDPERQVPRRLREHADVHDEPLAQPLPRAEHPAAAVGPRRARAG